MPIRGDMIPKLTRFEPLTEFFVPPEVTASQLTQYIDELVDDQVQQLALMYQKLFADLEREASRIKRSTRDAWLAKSRPPTGIGEPAAIRRRLEQLPGRPPMHEDRSDIPEFRFDARERGVYIRLTSGCYRNADMRAYDSDGSRMERVCIVDDPVLRLGAARYLWSVVDWGDPLPRQDGGGRK